MRLGVQGTQSQDNQYTHQGQIPKIRSRFHRIILLSNVECRGANGPQLPLQDIQFSSQEDVKMKVIGRQLCVRFCSREPKGHRCALALDAAGSRAPAMGQYQAMHDR